MSTIAIQRLQYLQKRISRFNDQLAYKELFASLYPSLFQFVTRILKIRQPAEEIVSDVFIRIWEKRETLEEINNIQVYCFVTARHLCINHLKKQKRQQTLNIEDHIDQLLYLAPDPVDRMISVEMLRQIYKVVESLPPRCKICFQLVKEQRVSYKEAAEILQLSEKTIGNQLAIALKKINSSIQFDISRSIPLIGGLSA